MRKKIFWVVLFLSVSALILVWRWPKPGRVLGDIPIKVAEAATGPTNWEIVQRLTGRDLLKEQNVQLDRIPSVGGGAPSYQSLLAGQYDVASFAWVGWINVIAKGGKIKAVNSGSAMTKALKDRSGILVLQDSGINTIRDLKGKTIAVNTLGLAAEYVIKLLLQKNGLSLDQVVLLQVPVEKQEQALRTKQVDAAVGTTGGGTWFDLTVAHGGVKIVPGTSQYDLYGQDQTSTGDGFREDFIQAHPDEVKRYVTAVETAKRIIWTAYQKDPVGLRKIYAEITEAKNGNPEYADFYTPANPESSLIKARDVQYWIDVLVAEGKLKPGEVKPADIYTDEFNIFSKNKL